MAYGPNSQQVEDYMQQVARLDTDDWVSLALTLKGSTEPSDAALEAIETARSRAKRHGLLSDVDAAAREARETMGVTLDSSTSLREVDGRMLARVGPDDPTLTASLGDAGVAVLRAAAISGVTLLVLRPLLDKREFTEAWRMPVIDPKGLPDHVRAPRIGATAF